MVLTLHPLLETPGLEREPLEPTTVSGCCALPVSGHAEPSGAIVWRCTCGKRVEISDPVWRYSHRNFYPNRRVELADLWDGGDRKND